MNLTRAYIAWAVVCVVWGTTYLGIGIALETMPVALLAGLRWLLAGIVLAALVPLFGERLPPIRLWGRIALTGFLMAVLGNGGVVWAQQYVPSGLAAVIVATVPFWSVLVEALRPAGERVTRRGVLGLLIGFAGIVVLVWPELTIGGASGRAFIYGVIALQIATLGWALGTSYMKRNPTGASPLGASAVQMLLSGIMLIGIGTALGEWNALHFNARSAAAMAYLVLVGSVIGYSAYVYALKYLPISTVSLYAYINPIIAVVLGALVLDEPFDMRVIGASALVLVGVAVVRAQPKAAPAVVTARPAPYTTHDRDACATR
jgi:drug/metabolite transporter (DMT)-like permease